MIFFVPARKGSERIKSKNLRLVGGRPLVEWTFFSLCAVLNKRARKDDEALISTDDPELAEIADRYGFRVAIRPNDLADSRSTMSSVLFHHSDQGAFDGHQSVCVLYPTSPLRTAENIMGALFLWGSLASPKKTLMSVSPVRHRPVGLMRINQDGFLKCHRPEGELYYQAQGMPPDFRANGAIYIFPSEALKDRLINTQLFGTQTIPYIMEETEGLEIDEETDIVIAEALMRQKQSSALTLAMAGAPG